MSDATNDFSLANLGEAELALLAQLVRVVVRSDGELSTAERERIDLIAEVAGEGFWEMMDEASTSDEDLDDLFKDAGAIASKDAQELIYGTLYELSITDGTDGDENAILDRLAALWRLEIQEVNEI